MGYSDQDFRGDDQYRNRSCLGWGHNIILQYSMNERPKVAKLAYR
jgi:hypothetical protein